MKSGCLLRRLLSGLMSLMLMAACISLHVVEVQASSYDNEGTITQEVYLTISSVRELNEFAQKVSNGNSYAGKLIKLTQDIQFDGVTINNFNGGGTFNGVFDGCGHTISGINLIGSYGLHLFSEIGGGGTVKNVTVKDFSFTNDGYNNGGYSVGAIAGYNYGVIENVTVKDSYLAGGYSVGAIAGYNYGVVENVTVKDSNLSGYSVGAIAGYNYGIIENCHNRNSDVAGACVGGIVGDCTWHEGWNEDMKGDIINCSSTGNIKGTVLAGGIVALSEGNIINCCNIGNISFECHYDDNTDDNNTDYYNSYCGGIVGLYYGGHNTIQNCYNAGIITGDSDCIGGIVRNVFSGIIANCFCSEESAEANFGVLNGIERNNKSLPASEMQTESFVSQLNANRGSNADWLEWEINQKESLYPLLVKIEKLNPSECQISLSSNSMVYDGTEKRPEVVIVYDGKTMANGTDYTLTYRNNTNAGTAEVLVEGKGKYSGSVTKTFVIEKANIAEEDVSVLPTNLTYNGKAQELSIVIKSNNKTLTYGTDYTLTYRNNTNAGTAHVTVEGKGNYTGSVTKAFVIEKANQSISGTKTYKKTYGDKKFSLNANSIGDGKLTYSSSDKKVAIVDKNGVVTVKGTGIAVITVKADATVNYNANTAGMKVTLNVSPARQIIKSIKAVKGKKLTVKWKKDTKATGYQIQYCTDKKFKKGVKTVDIKKNKTTVNTIAKLKKGQKYYVRVRSYKNVKVNGKTAKLYGKWSNVKQSANIKK